MKSHNRKSYIKGIGSILNEIVELKSPNLEKEIPPIHRQKIHGILNRQNKKLPPYIIIKTIKTQNKNH